MDINQGPYVIGVYCTLLYLVELFINVLITESCHSVKVNTRNTTKF